ncbi:methyltransferase family protein [Roseateles toxinivorans]|uniref:Protein-S-isoprenylcysteine O-methyltransferase Ste14 n=1 Tax=Roseateles toxinivorans TaxID=270368 RepID=A0A4V3CTE8_9BURK|nr:hypothetical protein [Roseateles toxinivorans]TDP71557.1 protein-S-isoprenylcysteine O-methyltransferase Ste14 [Roseateles toxinivorans]
MLTEHAISGRSELRWRLCNLAASLTTIALACSAYALMPYNQKQLSTRFSGAGLSFSGLEFLVLAALAYAVTVAVWHLSESQPGCAKSLRCWYVLAAFAQAPRRTFDAGLAPADRLALLATLLKCFFGPLMGMSLMLFCVNAWVNGAQLMAGFAGADNWRDGLLLFNRHGYWFALQLLLFVDVLAFTLGYLVELPRLGNAIRSVDPTWLGWGAALLCYPPFNSLTNALLGSQLSEFPQFANPTVHLLMNLLLLAAMAGYAASSLALGLKASNLTHRGIVARGPYALVRHPAYVCKNLAWLIGSLPALFTAFGQSPLTGLQALGSVLGWAALYLLRALTEEDHLRRVDGDYAAYAARVRYRFIPGLV